MVLPPFQCIIIGSLSIVLLFTIKYKEIKVGCGLVGEPMSSLLDVMQPASQSVSFSRAKCVTLEISPSAALPPARPRR